MVIVTGSLLARPETADEIRRLSLEHVHRSRREPGCISHDVHEHVETPLRFVFVERWRDMASLRVHFLVPESRAFSKAVSALAAERPVMEILDGELVTP
jgi:quinol monooxygenase YgiN